MLFVRDTELGTALRHMREARDMSQARVARMAGLTAACLARFESGEARVPAIVLSRVATGLGVPLSAFFTTPGTIAPAAASLHSRAVH